MHGWRPGLISSSSTILLLSIPHQAAHTIPAAASMPSMPGNCHWAIGISRCRCPCHCSLHQPRTRRCAACLASRPPRRRRRCSKRKPGRGRGRQQATRRSWHAMPCMRPPESFAPLLLACICMHAADACGCEMQRAAGRQACPAAHCDLVPPNRACMPQCLVLPEQHAPTACRRTIHKEIHARIGCKLCSIDRSADRAGAAFHHIRGTVV